MASWLRWRKLAKGVPSVDWLIHDDSLIALRAKGMGSRPLTVVYDGKVKFWVYMEILGIPLMLIGLGLVLWRMRTARRAAAAF